jgi:tRNA (pseudouridine54-N1)-methyltransferase
MRRFVVIGRTASASPGFLLHDLPGTSGRLDLLVRCVRAALLVSHGIRRDTQVYLILLGGPDAPRTIRIDGAIAEYLRPDERSLAGRLQKALLAPRGTERFTELTGGLAIADGGLDVVLGELGEGAHYVLDERGADVRSLRLALDCVIFVGDHLGFDEATRARLTGTAISVGPVSVHADDAIAIVNNELDRQSR